MLMIHTGMLGIVVVTGNRENDIKSVASVLNEIGVGGLNIEIAADNEPYLMDLVAKGLHKSNARVFCEFSLAGFVCVGLVFFVFVLFAFCRSCW